MASVIIAPADLLRVLAAEHHTNERALSQVEQTEKTETYRQGFNAALAAVALAFGLVPVSQPNKEVVYWKDA